VEISFPTFVTDDVPTRAISGLRRIFCDDPKAPQVIRTIPKAGYRLIAPIVPVEPQNRRIHSLLVLPFVNGGADPGTDYLSDGITECLINVLSRSNRKISTGAHKRLIFHQHLKRSKLRAVSHFDSSTSTETPGVTFFVHLFSITSTEIPSFLLFLAGGGIGARWEV
jgi:hypothetical protein